MAAGWTTRLGARCPHKVPLIAVALGLAVSLAAAADEVRHGQITVKFSDVDPTLAKLTAETADAALASLTALLEAPAPQPVTVEVNANLFAPEDYFEERRYELPASRLTGNINGKRFLRCRGPALWHAMALFVAPREHPSWGEFFLQGLGVYAERKFAPARKPQHRHWSACEKATDKAALFAALLERPYPTMGADVHMALKRLVDRNGEFITLANVEQQRQSAPSGLARRMALLTAGSFTTWLIEEKGGFARFAKVLNGASLAAAYGEQPDALEAAWQRHVKQT